MSKPREWRDKRDLKYHDSIQRNAAQVFDFNLSLSTETALISCVDENGNLRLERKTPEPLHVNAMSKENEGN